MSVAAILATIVSFLLHEWKSLFEIFAKIFSFAIRDKNHGTYAGLEFEVNLELLDATGYFARYHKRHRVKFLQNNVRLYQDIMWGKGNWYTDYKCYPGERTNISNDGDRWNIEILLKDAKNKGDIEEFHIQTTAQGVFTEPEERLQVEIRNPTQLLRLQVVFPPNRHSKKIVIMQRGQNKAIEVGGTNISLLPDGRQVVTWQTRNIKPLEIYTLRWNW